MNNKTKQKEWTKTEEQFLISNRGKLSLREIARSLGRNLAGVAGKNRRLPDKAANNEPLADYWKREAQIAQKALSEVNRGKTAVEILVEKATELAPTSYQPTKGARPQAKRGKGSPQSAVLMFSDCHIGQVVTPDQTLNLGGYSFEIFLRRLAQLEKSIFSILEDHTTTSVPEIVIAMIGDVLHGALSHSVEAGQQNTLFNQFYAAGHAISQFLRNLSTIAPLRIYTAVGNHPRMPTQKKMPTENRYSNFDFFLYSYLQALLRDIPTIQFHIDAQPFALFEVQGHGFFAGHGDSLRGGDRILGIPNHAVGRTLSNTAQNFASVGRKFPNYFLLGHFHRPITLPHASGQVIINGGWPGVDGFALMEAFNSSKPSQKLFLMHKKFGQTAAYDLRLDFGDPNPHHYQLPDKFSCR